ncbi:ditrans,polycis-polyprenyl diphosphate synthase [Aspergillus lucknowensis]|uniref:ditrans,polycis-polyprenyl diphosphate synthase [(2E,6E)-farnesyldiphosphate specific] n=1 Tax=Aspergillus lucknowensis TaxID=176173 RepID=A0ABR4LY08_9EURO
MVSKIDRELLRDNIRSRGSKLSATDRENILKPYLPDPAELPRWPPQRRKKVPRKTPIRTFLKSQIHLITYAFLHIFFGIAVRLLRSYHAVIDRILAIVYYHHRTPELIRKDVKGLDRLPNHLSVILSLRKEDNALPILMDEVAELVSWTASAGIPVLSVYEKSGALKSCIPILHQAITNKLSSYFGSAQQPTLQLFAPHHPVYEHRRDESIPHKSLVVLLLSATDGQETFVDLTKTLAEMSQNGKLSPEDITTELVDAEISEITTQPSQEVSPAFGPNIAYSSQSSIAVNPEPDLLLVFGPSMKLDGYPPWHIRLTEIYHAGVDSDGAAVYSDIVEYQGFLRGLWRYSGAQMRFGR